MRVCSKCHIEKDDSEFYKRGWPCLDSRCKECMNTPEFKKKKAEIHKQWVKNNKRKKRLWEQNNPEKARAINRKSNKKSIKQLNDSYIKKMLKKTGQTLLSDDAIEIKRIKILSKRIRAVIKKHKPA